MAQTIINKAKELIEQVGRDEARKIFEQRIKELGQPKNFEDICVLSGLETAIEFIDGEL